MSTTIRVSDDARERIARLAAEADRPMTAIVDDALDALERHRFFEQYNRRHAELAGDEAAWAEIVAERAVEATEVNDITERLDDVYANRSPKLDAGLALLQVRAVDEDW